MDCSESEHEILVADIVEEMVLGVDFMRTYRFVVDFENSVFKVRN